MKTFFKFLFLFLLFSAAQNVYAADTVGGQDIETGKDVIHLKLNETDLQNPVEPDEKEDKIKKQKEKKRLRFRDDNEDVDLQQIEDALPENNAEMYKSSPQFSIDNIFDKDRDNKIDEDTLLGKIIHRDITRTDVPTYLLREELTFTPKKGPVSKMQFFGAYQGGLNSFWQSSDYDFGYNHGIDEIGVIGKFRHAKTDFKLMVKPRPKDDLNYIQSFIGDAYIVNSSIPHHKLVIGYSRNQIGKEGGSSSYILPFVVRSQIARTFGNHRALGVRLVGNYSLLDYNLALNSSDRYFRQWFPGAEFTGWVDVKPFGKTDGRYGNLIIGGGLNAGHNNTDYTVGSFYVGYKYKKLWTNFEYAIADGYNGFDVSTDRAMGFNYTIGYKITPKIQLIGRYDFFDPNRDIADNNRREYTAGINYFIKGQALRLILNYVYCQNDAMPDSHRVIFATQVVL